MFGSRKHKDAELPDEEWNFAEILEEDAEACLRYELAREIQNPESYFSSFASREQAPFALEPWLLSPQEDREASSDFKQQRASMYIRPFDVPEQGQVAEMREMLPGLYFLHRDGGCRAYPAKFLENPWLSLDEALQANIQVYTEQFLTGVSFYPDRDLQDREEKRQGSAGKIPEPAKLQTFVMKIDWSRNDSSLIEGFTAWIRRERPKNIPSVHSSGRQSTFDSLHALSALRLRHHLSIEDAIKRTKSVSRKSLYNDRSSWDRAQRRAVQLFHAVFPGAGAPKSESRISNRKSVE